MAKVFITGNKKVNRYFKKLRFGFSLGLLTLQSVLGQNRSDKAWI